MCVEFICALNLAKLRDINIVLKNYYILRKVNNVNNGAWRSEILQIIRGKTHLDAALKVMAALTFPEKLVRVTVDELLEVYGGDDGWGFIEDASYSVLIDTLLDKQQDGTEKGIASPQGHARSENGTEISAVVPSLSGVSSCTPMKAVQSQTNQPLNSAPLTKMPDSKDCLPSNRRRPYHGWIGNDDDEDLVLVELTPAPLPQELKKLFNWVL